VLEEAGWTLTWTRLNVNLVVHILYLLLWHPGPLLKVCLKSTSFFFSFWLFSKLELSGFPYNARFYTSFKWRKLINRFVQWDLTN
jgi:hypothetical protein